MASSSLRQKILAPFLLILVLMILVFVGLLLAYVTFSEEAKLRFLVFSICLLLLCAFGVFLAYSIIVRKVTSSLEIVSVVASKVAKGDLDQQLHIDTDDEIGDLAQSFNLMVYSLKELATNFTDEMNRSKAVVAHLPEAVIVTDTDNQLILANPLAESMFGFSLEEAVGRPLSSVVEDPELYRTIALHAAENQGKSTREVRITDSTDKISTYLLSSNVAKNRSDDVTGTVTILRDISRERELEELREGFLRTVTHELRTPLTSIIGFIDLMVRGAAGEVPKDVQKYLSIALKEANGLKHLIDDLLDLSRISAGNMKLMKTQVRLHDFLDGLDTTLSHLASRKGLDLKICDVDKDLVLSFDIGKLRRVMINLISNAIKFTDHGTITVACEEKGSQVVFMVQDTGIGIAAEEQESIFEKFRQVDYSSTRKYEGIGLGLSIVKQLVELHGGRVWVESDLGQGASFYFTIPT